MSEQADQPSEVPEGADVDEQPTGRVVLAPDLAISVDQDAAPDAGTVTVVHGGEEGTQARWAVMDGDTCVTVVLLPADHHQLPAERQYRPDEGLVLREVDDDEPVAPGHRWTGTSWEAAAPTSA